jgi:ATP-dependent DNA helicase
VDSSGKMMVLERLLDALFARGHKVLIFSQFKIGLDIIEDWASDSKGWPLCRIDGETDATTRRAEMARFQTGGDNPDAPKLFLLTTRAGGQGINLTAVRVLIWSKQTRIIICAGRHSHLLRPRLEPTGAARFASRIIAS